MLVCMIDRRGFKKVISPAKQHQLRNETTLQIRKMKKEEMLKRRRSTEVENPENINEKEEFACLDLGFKKVRLTSTAETVNHLMEQLRQLSSDKSTSVNEVYLLEILRDIRRNLSNDDTAPRITKFLARGLLACLYHKIQIETNATILYEILWILVNVTSSKVSAHLEAVSTSGLVPYIVNLVMHANAGVQEHAIFVLANLAGDRSEYRSKLLEMPAVMHGLLYNFENTKNVSHMCTCAWALSNIFQHLPHEKINHAIPFVPKLCAVIQQGVRGHVIPTELTDVMAAMLHLVESGTELNSLVCETGVPATIVDAIRHYMTVPQSTTLLNYAIRVLGNIAAGTEEQTEVVVQSGFLDLALSLLQQSKERIIHRSVLFSLSNIAAGTTEQIDALITQPNLAKKIVWMADNSPSDVKKEAIWTLANIITKGTLYQANKTVLFGSISALCNLLRTPYDVKLVIVVLDAIEKLLVYNQSSELGYLSLVEFCNGVEAIEELQTIQNDEVYEKACKIIVDFFDGEEEDLDGDQNIAPMISEESATYAFGTTETMSLPRKQLFPETIYPIPTGPSGTSFISSSTTFGGSTQMNKMFR
jgi:importin subunit alpha-6/7